MNFDFRSPWTLPITVLLLYHINFFVLFYCFSRLMALKRMGIVENYEVRVG